MHSKSNEWKKLTDYSDTDEETSDQEIRQARRPTRLPVERPRTPNSIPSKCQSYTLIKGPEIHFEYQLPNCPEKYLLPVRFPALYSKIVASLNSARGRLEEKSSHKQLAKSKMKAF